MQFNNQLIDLPNLHQVIDRYPLTISPNSHVIDAIFLMNQEQNNSQNNSLELLNFSASLPCSKWHQQGSSYILVVKETQLLGIFTLRDVLRLTALGIDLAKMTMAEVMTQQPIILKQSNFQDISIVLSIWRQYRIHHLPIVDDEGKLVGIITESSLLKEFDLMKIVAIVETVEQYFDQSRTELQPNNQQIKGISYQADNLLKQCLVVERTKELVAANEALQQEINERKQTESALRKSEEKFRQFTANSQTLIWMASKDGQETLYINAAYEKIWGRSCQSLLEQPQSWREAIHPEDRDRILAEIEERHQKAESASLEYRIVQPNGTIRWIWGRCFPIKNEQGELDYYGSITEDITERKQAETALRESETRLTLALEAAKMGIWDWNLTTNNSIWSDNVGPLYGLPSGTLCPTSDQEFFNLIHPEDLKPFTQALNRAIEQKIPFYIEYRAIWPDGSLHWLNGRGTVYYDANGQPMRMIGITKDISERKETEQQLSEQAALLDIATDAIFVRDFQTEILFWNQGAERIYGWQTHEALGKNLKDIFSSKTSSQQEAVALKTVVKSGIWQGELRKQTKFGKEIIVESRWTLMFDTDGQPKSILIVDTDITEKKQLEEQFFRTQRLESIGTLAGGIAHDLNNILTPILGAAQLLKGRFAKDEECHPQLLTIIENNAKRGAALVKQVLSFARGLKGERAIVQIKHLIAEIMQIGRQTFPKSIEFTTQIPEDLWAVSGDTTQLHQVLMNLVVNARDAMPEGGNLKISAENIFIDETYTRMHLESKVGHYIVITITDTGIGMSPEIVDRMFEPFFTTKEVGAGTGLGLSTVLGIVKSHGGFVTVCSQVDKGSQFKIFLPSVEAHQVPSIDKLEIAPGNGELILVVDDEPQILDVATIILKNHNYQTLTANNGIEAIAIYAQHKKQINAVLMDMMMPEMDGITAIRTLQKMNPKVQVIACSGLSTIEVLPESGETEVQAVLLKPYTANELLRNLNQILTIPNS